MNVALIAETLRSMRRRPTPFVAAIAVLAVAATLFVAITSVVSAFLLRPSMVHDIDRVVRVRERISAATGAARLNVSPQMFDAWRKAQDVFAGMAAATTQNVALQGERYSDSLSAGVVTTDFFHVLGIAPQLGRDFAAGEDAGNGGDVVLLGDALWRKRFGADPGIVGRVLRVDGRQRTVIGVMPRGLSHPYGAELWLPFGWDDLTRRIRGRFLYVPARLRDGVDVGAAGNAFDALTASIHRERPELGQADAAALTPLREEMLRDLRPTLWLLFGCAAFVMLVAILNVATLFHAQNVAEAGARFVRLALGATRGVLFRRALVRSGLVVVPALAAAALVATQLLAPLAQLGGNAPVREFGSAARLDAPTCAALLATGLLLVLVLAAADLRHGVPSTMRADASARGGSHDHRARRRLALAAITQCMLSFALAAVALVVTLGYRHLLTLDRGYRRADLVAADLAFPRARYATPAGRDALVARLLQSLRAEPDIEAAAGSTVTPDYDGDWVVRFVAPGRAPPPDTGYESTNHRLVTPGYFAAMGMRLRAGRDFDAVNPQRDANAVIVSRSFADHVWPGLDPLGRAVDRLDAQRNVIARLHVIGVAEDVVEAVRDPDAPASRSWYLPTTAGTDYDYAAITIVARGATERVAAAMRAALARIDPELAWYNLEPMEARLAETVARERLGSFLFSLFALCAVATALCGLYGTLAFVAETCRHEFGVRFALGARAGQVLSGQLASALRLAAIGVGGGLLLALPLIRIAGAYVYGVSLRDAWMLPLLGLAMLVLALFAGLAPACRAARVPPMEALRDA